MSNIFHYAIEIYTSSTVTDAGHGIDNGVFRFITDRPHYDSVTVIPVYGPSEIDILGKDVSNTDNTNVYYQDFLLKDGIDGNAFRSIDITTSGSYGNDATFSFKLRGDKVSSSYFWDFCKTNSIVLSNSIVIFYVVLDDVFWMQWRGRVDSNSYTDENFSIQCKDDATTIHKILPPYVDQIITTTSSGLELNTISNSNVTTVNGVTLVPGQTESEVVIPVIFGDVAFSPVTKTNDQNVFQILVQNYAGRQSNTCAASNYTLINGQLGLSTVTLITTGKLFTTDELIGQYLSVSKGQNANTDTIYKITSNVATAINSNGFYLTVVHLDGMLIDSNNKIIIEADFNSTYLSAEKYSYFITDPAHLDIEAHASENTWWFQVSLYEIDTQLSTVNYLDGSTPSGYGAESQSNAKGNYILSTYDKNSNSYIDISSLVTISSTNNIIKLTANTATLDGKITQIESIGNQLLYFAMRTSNPSNADFPGYAASLVTGSIHNSAADIAAVTNRDRTTSVPIGVTMSGLNDYYFVAGFNLKPLLNDYDRILFVADLVLTNASLQPMKLGALSYSLFDYNKHIIHPYVKTSSLGLIHTVFFIDSTPVSPFDSNFNLIPNSYYSSVPVGDTISLFYAQTGNDPIGQTLPWALYCDFDDTDLSKDDLNPKSEFIDFIECALRMNCYLIPPWTGLQVTVKELALIGIRTVDTITGDLFSRMRGELTGAGPGNPTHTSTDAGKPTNDVYHTIMHILEDYDGIPKELIYYGNLSTYRSQWHIGRTLDNQQNSLNYLNEIASQSFIGIFGNRKGQRAFNAWLHGPSGPDTSFTATTGTGKTATHNSAIIVDGSISNYDKTDFSQIYNSFQLQYNYDYGSKSYTRVINVSNVDAASFPASTDDWQEYVSGLPNSAYADAKTIWTECAKSYTDNHVTQLANSDLQKLPWFIDSSIFDSKASIGTGTTSSAFYLLKFLAYWSTRQKDLVTYSIPINSNTAATELLDCITFNDDVYTNGTNVTGWIVSIEVDANNSQYIIQTILQSADMVSAGTTIPSAYDERGTSSSYIDSISETTINTDSWDER